MERPSVYILASSPDGAFVICATSNIYKRMAELSRSVTEGLDGMHPVQQLVYYEVFETMLEATQREKRLKERPWASLVQLISSLNPDWRNLFDPATGDIASG